ncbi:BON domain-containing protein [Methylococcus sp. EFPC2]|uniref:BON domain-containing protein n=1 Tax=Methylococcus sp. EFPC2 TaxID=2812648 RepID=UPI0019685827|nr:BON domain-containing protein [Methylococcus sp. EFPC2]QSA97753.1 BON domain-containing protein [Methylococcus sp. EFPC2]
MKTRNGYKRIYPLEGCLSITCLSAILGLTACQQEGTAEKAGQEIDRAAKRVEKSIEAAKESLDKKADKTDAYIDDSVITLKVKTAISNEPLLGASRIEVTTVNGVVKLSGKVDSELNIGRASEIAWSQENVKSVHTDLVVDTRLQSEK